jgi:hypothetical protein
MYGAVRHSQDTLGGIVDMILQEFARTIAVGSVALEIERNQLPTVLQTPSKRLERMAVETKRV